MKQTISTVQSKINQNPKAPFQQLCERDTNDKQKDSKDNFSSRRSDAGPKKQHLYIQDTLVDQKQKMYFNNQSDRNNKEMKESSVESKKSDYQDYLNMDFEGNMLNNKRRTFARVECVNVAEISDEYGFPEEEIVENYNDLLYKKSNTVLGGGNDSFPQKLAKQHQNKYTSPSHQMKTVKSAI